MGITAGQLKGALLEYIVRRLLIHCGFSSVKPDGHYIYEQRGLFFINGKGAAHDADVLMEPPIQIPFSYPSRLLFECKAYKTQVGLTTIRNALGLRYDINEFEIVTDSSIQERKNNKRGSYAISDRRRHNYEVGVAAVEGFSTPAFEFGANNKIPLLSLRWFLNDASCDAFGRIDDKSIRSIPSNIRSLLYQLLKDQRPRDHIFEMAVMKAVLDSDQVVGKILRDLEDKLNESFIALNESGDIFFLFSDESWSAENIRWTNNISLKARIHYHREERNVWHLEFVDSNLPRMRFYVPERVMRIWEGFSWDRASAIDLKQEFFSRMFIFSRQGDQWPLPFISVTIDQRWLSDLRQDMT